MDIEQGGYIMAVYELLGTKVAFSDAEDEVTPKS